MISPYRRQQNQGKESRPGVLGIGSPLKGIELVQIEKILNSYDRRM